MTQKGSVQRSCLCRGYAKERHKSNKMKVAYIRTNWTDKEGKKKAKYIEKGFFCEICGKFRQIDK